MEISSKYDPREIEKRIYRFWLESGAFNAAPSRAKKSFTIVIPPPNVTGILHMGHALNNTIQDVLVRFKRLAGFEALWMPGTDHAGIATQNVVERSLAKEGLRKEDIGREKFLERLWDWTDKHGSTIIDQLKTLGASCDWRRTRFTMDDEYSNTIKDVFIALYNEKLIYRGSRLINWCPRCKTALSDEESAHKELDGWLYYLKYPIDGTTIDGKDYVVVATTRPETMLGDTAVAVNPQDFRYHDLKKAKVILPLVNRELKVIEDECIDPQFGTGVVKVTPSHDPADFIMGRKHNLEFINIFNEDATLNANVPEEFAGMDRFEARQALLTLLEEKMLIEKKEPYKLKAGHCYRCNTIIEPRISPQWFVRMAPLAAPAIKAVEEDKIQFYPPRWKKVYLNWMNNIQDWCISRQIWWGHRIPVWYCSACRANGGDGIIAAKNPPEKCPRCASTALEQENDVLDTWFSSWLWPFATFKDKTDLDYFYPTDTLVTASEILFFWVARMIMAGLKFQGKIPFKDVVIHGTVRDAQGVKMSKSLGNTIDPLEIIDKFGTDALRFSLMMLAAAGSDVYLSEEKFMVGRNFCNKIWNAARFLSMQIERNAIKLADLNIENTEAIDKWAIEEFNSAAAACRSALENYRLNDAVKRAYDFFWHTFCDWYIEIAKDRFTPDRAKVLIRLLVESLKMLHPFMPFITQEIYHTIAGIVPLSPDSIMSSLWPEPVGITFAPEEKTAIFALIDTVVRIRNIKADLGMNTQKVILEVMAREGAAGLWKDNQDWIKRLALLDGVEVVKCLKRTLYKSGLWDINLRVPDIDHAAFLTALEKKISGLESVSARAAGKLSNDKFVKNAPADVVEQERERFAAVRLELKRLKELSDAFK